MEGVNRAILGHHISRCRHLLPNRMKNMFQLGRFHSIENICGTLREKFLFICHRQFCSILRSPPSCFPPLLKFWYMDILLDVSVYMSILLFLLLVYGITFHIVQLGILLFPFHTTWNVARDLRISEH